MEFKPTNLSHIFNENREKMKERERWMSEGRMWSLYRIKKNIRYMLRLGINSFNAKIVQNNKRDLKGEKKKRR